MTTHNTLSVLFVCLGNICRSPLAEGIFSQRLSEKNLDNKIRVDSAGTGDWHIGSPADPRSISVAEENKIVLDGKARLVSQEDFHCFDYIFAMDRHNLNDLEDLQRQHGGKAKIRLFREFDTSTESTLDVPDPYYGGIEDFRDAFDLLDSTCRQIIDHLVEKFAL